MTFADGVSASIHEAWITGNMSGPFRLNKNACARGGNRNQWLIPVQAAGCPNSLLSPEGRPA
jgi:hypothetical protein